MAIETANRMHAMCIVDATAVAFLKNSGFSGIAKTVGGDLIGDFTLTLSQDIEANGGAVSASPVSDTLDVGVSFKLKRPDSATVRVQVADNLGASIDSNFSLKIHSFPVVN